MTRRYAFQRWLRISTDLRECERLVCRVKDIFNKRLSSRAIYFKRWRYACLTFPFQRLLAFSLGSDKVELLIKNHHDKLLYRFRGLCFSRWKANVFSSSYLDQARFISLLGVSTSLRRRYLQVSLSLGQVWV